MFHTPSFGDEDFDMTSYQNPQFTDHRPSPSLIGQNSHAPPAMRHFHSPNIGSIPFQPKFPPANFYIPDIEYSNSVFTSHAQQQYSLRGGINDRGPAPLQGAHNNSLANLSFTSMSYNGHADAYMNSVSLIGVGHSMSGLPSPESMRSSPGFVGIPSSSSSTDYRTLVSPGFSGNGSLVRDYTADSCSSDDGIHPHAGAKV